MHGEWQKGMGSVPRSIARSEPLAPMKVPDRRRHPRHDVIGYCWIDTPDLTLFGPTHDIGAGGLFVRTAAELQLGTSVQVSLHVPGESDPVVARARVARCVPIGFGPPGHGLGLSFVKVLRGLSLLRSVLARSTPALG